MPSLFFQLPLTDPVLIFSLILFLILVVPMVLHRFKIPDLIGLIIAGAIVGQNGLGILLRDSSIEIFGKVGLLYIMFVAGLKIDLADLQKNYGKSLYFGIVTFVVPMILGMIAGFYLLNLSFISSMLLASIFASHTLMTYPIVVRYNVTKNRAVNISIGATVITCLFSLLVLAGVVSSASGEGGTSFWLKLSSYTLLFIAVVIFLFPIIGRIFFKKCHDRVAQYIFILAMVFLASFLAKLIGLEDIIGAFLAGLALNRLVPETSALMNRIEFIGNALFIPYFLIGVGMLVDYRIFTTGYDSLWVAFVMCFVAILSKYCAAWFAGKTLHYTKNEINMLFGLTNSQAVATLAAVMVGYATIIGNANDEPIRLFGESILNGTIVMILVTCTLSSFVTQQAAGKIALSDISVDDAAINTDKNDERILIPLSNPENVEELINLGVTIKSAKSFSSLLAINIINMVETDMAVEKSGRLLLERAAKAAAATETPILTSVRYSSNIANGIINVVKENKASYLVLGLKKDTGLSETFLGDLIESILTRCTATTLVYRSAQPLATVRRYWVLIPPGAEVEAGFPYWLLKVWNLGRNTGAKILFNGTTAQMALLQGLQAKHAINAAFNTIESWNQMEDILSHIHKNDALVAVMNRRFGTFHAKQTMNIPMYMDKYFTNNNCILIYPIQMGENERSTFFYNNEHSDHESVYQMMLHMFHKN